VRVIFCGTPEIAVPSLQALAEIAEIVGVVCQPDRPAGRGLKLTPPPVKVEAQARGLEVFQPTKVKDGSLARWMHDRRADLALVIAYGRILTLETLNAPRLGCVNLHASLLPAYRGAAPIQRALMDGCTETGVCLMRMDEGMDTGAVLSRRPLRIETDDDAGSLALKLGELAAQMTRDDLPRLARGELTPQPQDEGLASYAPPLSKNDAILDFTQPASRLLNHVRGVSPRPGAFCFLDGSPARRFKIRRALEYSGNLRLAPGQVGEENGLLLVGTGDGNLVVVDGQLEGKTMQSGAELLRGRTLLLGSVLKGSPPC